MRKKSIFVPLIIIACILLSGCGSRDALFYVPIKNPTPLFKNKGNIFMDISAGPVKADATIGCAFTNSLAVYASSGAALNKLKNNSIILKPSTYTEFRYNNATYNLGAGYFINQKISPDWRFEIFGDYGFGLFFNKNTVHHFNSLGSPNIPSRNYDLNGKYEKIGLLLNIGYTDPYDYYTTFAYSVRASRITFSNMTVSDSVYWKKEITSINSKPSHMLMEHGFTFRWGENDRAKFQMYLGLSHYLQHNKYQHLNASIMFGVFINNIF